MTDTETPADPQLLYTLHYKPLNILVCGKTCEEVNKAFICELMTLWDALVKEKDNNLTQDAKDPKEKLNDLIIEPDPTLIQLVDELVKGVL